MQNYIQSLYPSVLSSICEVIVTQPLDVIKTHLQANSKIKWNIQTMYSGLFRRAIGNVPSRSVFLLSQDIFKNMYGETFGNLNRLGIVIVPMSAGFCQTLVDTPFEVLKINKIMNIRNDFLYRGFIPHVCRNMVFVIPVFNFREYARKQYSDNPFAMGCYGSLGGIIGSYLSHPLDTIKTRMQSNKSCSNLTVQDYFKGAHLRAGIGIINMLVSITIFELITSYSNK